MSDWETSKSPKNEKIKKESDITIARGEKVSSATFKNVIKSFINLPSRQQGNYWYGLQKERIEYKLCIFFLYAPCSNLTKTVSAGLVKV